MTARRRSSTGVRAPTAPVHLLQLLPASLRGGNSDPFPQNLEGEYQQHIGPEKIRTIQLSCLLVIVLTLPFAIVDIWALPNNLAFAWAIRGVCFVMALAVFRATRHPRFLSRYTPIGVCLFLSVGLMIDVLVAISGPLDAARAIYSSGVLLPIMAMYALSFLSIRITFSVSFVFVAVYGLIGFGLHGAIGAGQRGTVLTNMLLLASAAIIGLVSQLGRDVYERQAFLRRRSLDNELQATERARQLSEHYSNHDALTGLANRKAFEKRVAILLDGYRPEINDIAVLFIDIDGFKPVNDRYGHALGDKVLQVLGQRIVAVVSENDSVARMGGDEFVVALDLPRDQLKQRSADQLALSVAQRLVDDISRSISIEPGNDGQALTVRVGASIGIALASMHARNPAMLITIADQAMYQAKRSGKGAAWLADSSTQGLDLVV